MMPIRSCENCGNTCTELAAAGCMYSPGKRRDWIPMRQVTDHCPRCEKLEDERDEWKQLAEVSQKERNDAWRIDDDLSDDEFAYLASLLDHQTSRIPDGVSQVDLMMRGHLRNSDVWYMAVLTPRATNIIRRRRLVEVEAERDEWRAKCEAWDRVVAGFETAYSTEFFAPLEPEQVPRDGAAAHVGRIILANIRRAVGDEIETD